MGSIYFISPVNYGMNPVFTAVATFIFQQQDIINGGFTSQRVGAHVLLIYPHLFDPRRNKKEIAMTRLQQVHINSVDVEVTEDLLDIPSRPGDKKQLMYKDATG